MAQTVPALQFQQGEYPLLLFNLSAGDLKELSYFNPRDLDRTKGLQRKFDNRRSKAIANFINSENSILANNIILNLELEKNGLALHDVFDGHKIDIEKLKEKIKKKGAHPEHNKIAFVIDGQHRLRAFEQIDQDSFQLPVTALVDLSLAEAAELFVQINYNQKPVNKSHVFDLLGISENIFPKYFLLHNAVVLLQEDPSSPFYNKIKMLGVGKGFISQASLITALEKYKIQNTIEDEIGEFDEDILYDVMWNFFDAVEISFSSYWGEKKLLSKTVGIRALIKIMNDMLKFSFDNEIDFSSENIQKKFQILKDDFFEHESLAVLVGEKGVSIFYDALKKELTI